MRESLLFCSLVCRHCEAKQNDSKGLVVNLASNDNKSGAMVELGRRGRGFEIQLPRPLSEGLFRSHG